ncbi:MAG: hypothetical protein RL076_2048 [Chloroflexota bacterium]|jgi:surface antigen
MTRQWYLGLLVMLGLVVLTLTVSVWLPWTERLVQASPSLKSQYEAWLGRQCPKDNDKGSKGSYSWCQCSSFTAWRAMSAGVNEKDWQSNGHAREWVANVRRKNIATGKECRRGAVYQDGNHVMWVEECNGDGTVKVSEYNYNDRSINCYEGDYCTRTLTRDKASRGTYIYFSNVMPHIADKPQISAITKSSAKIGLTPPSSASYLCVRISDRMSTQGCTAKVLGGRSSSYTASGLKSNTEYTVVVQACNSKDVCSPGTQVRFRTSR